MKSWLKRLLGAHPDSIETAQTDKQGAKTFWLALPKMPRSAFTEEQKQQVSALYGVHAFLTFESGNRSAVQNCLRQVQFHVVEKVAQKSRKRERVSRY